MWVDLAAHWLSLQQYLFIVTREDERTVTRLLQPAAASMDQCTIKSRHVAIYESSYSSRSIRPAASSTTSLPPPPVQTQCYALPPGVLYTASQPPYLVCF